MNLADLNKVALDIVTPGKGILAADESSGTIKKRFDAIKVESTEENRRDYREMLFRSSEAMSKYVSGGRLHDERRCLEREHAVRDHLAERKRRHTAGQADRAVRCDSRHQGR